MEINIYTDSFHNELIEQIGQIVKYCILYLLGCETQKNLNVLKKEILKNLFRILPYYY